MATSQFSPGVLIQERDLTTGSTLSNPTFAAIAGPFSQGPVEEVRIITNERQFVSVFGKPNNSNFEYWFAAAQYLLYGGAIKVIRTNGSGLKNAVSNGTSVKINNIVSYETSFENGSNTWYYAAKTPGTYANGLRVYVTDAGADQVLTLPAPSSGDEWKFVKSAAVSTANGAAGKVFKYSLKVTVSSAVVGTFVPGAATIGGGACTILAWDPTTRVAEVELNGSYTGIVDTSDTLVQSSVGASGAVTAVSRQLLVVLNKGSIEFSTGNLTDANSNTAAISTAANEYLTREVLPGLKWYTVATRPGTSPYVAGKNGYRDELHVVVVDVTGTITGTPNTIVEKFVGLSKATDAKTTNGESNYYKTALKNRSSYLYQGTHDQVNAFTVGGSAAAGYWGQVAANLNFNLIQSDAGLTDSISGAVSVGSAKNSTVEYVFGSGSSAGVDANSPTSAERLTAFNLISDPEVETLDFIIPGPMGATETEALAIATGLVTIAETRKDCMVFFSPLRDHVVGVTDTDVATINVVNFFKKFPSSSYAVLDSGYKYIYDKYSDVYRYIPCNSDVAGLCLNTAIVSDPWYSPAGFQRGVLRNAIRLAYTPNKQQRDSLYTERVNPIVSFPGQGILLFGDKTALGYSSAFDRINVRRLFLVIEKVVANVSKGLLFDLNDETSRSTFRNIVEPYLRDVQGRRGLTDFLVKCDAENNTPESIDRGEFYAEIYLKPARTINYITVSFIATRTGVAFSEVAS